MIQRLLVAALYASTLASGAAAGDTVAEEPAPSVHRVAVRGMKYVPETLEVKAGDKIIWVNEDIVPHTVTAADKTLDSGLMQPKQSWSWVAEGKGERPYVCVFHPTMKGTVVVE